MFLYKPEFKQHSEDLTPGYKPTANSSGAIEINMEALQKSHMILEWYLTFFCGV